ncbi:MAG: peptide-methionine (S)-S-oxide reductase MsrA [Chthoniobacterales bacterium]
MSTLTTSTTAAETKKAVLAAGCFWCLEAIYERVPGVTDVISGYAGGHTENPTYESSNTGQTGHAEAVEITYDPAKVSFDELLDYYFKSFDPTEGRGVAPDFGSQYRPIAFYSDDTEKQVIANKIDQIRPEHDQPIAVEVTELEKFWKAEDYHQDYEEKNPNNPYIRNVSIPRMKRAGISK